MPKDLLTTLQNNHSLPINFIPVDTIKLWTDEYAWSGTEDTWNRVFDEVPHDLSLPQNTKFYYKDRDHTNWTVSISSDRLWLQGELAKLLHGNNHSLLRQSDWDNVFNALSKLLSKLGLSTSLKRLKLGRVDISVDLDLPFPVSFFLNEVYKLDSVDRMNKASQPSHRHNYVRFGASKNRGLVFYDRGCKTNADDLPTRRLRVEYKLLNTYTCRRKGLSSLSDLLDPSASLRLLGDVLAKVRKRSDALGILTPRKHKDGIQGELIRLLSSPGLRPVHLMEFIAARGGLRHVLESLGGRYALDSILKACLHSQTAYRYRQRIDGLEAEERSNSEETPSHSLQDGFDAVRRRLQSLSEPVRELTSRRGGDAPETSGTEEQQVSA